MRTRYTQEEAEHAIYDGGLLYAISCVRGILNCDLLTGKRIAEIARAERSLDTLGEVQWANNKGNEMTDQTWETTIHEQQWLDAPTGPGWWWVVDSGEFEKPDYAPILVAVQRRPDGRLWVGADLLRMVRDEPWAMEPVDDALGWGAHKLWSPACLTPQRKEPTK